MLMNSQFAWPFESKVNPALPSGSLPGVPLASEISSMPKHWCSLPSSQNTTILVVPSRVDSFSRSSWTFIFHLREAFMWARMLHFIPAANCRKPHKRRSALPARASTICRLQALGTSSPLVRVAHLSRMSHSVSERRRRRLPSDLVAKERRTVA
jgi:hypothetical protein